MTPDPNSKTRDSSDNSPSFTTVKGPKECQDYHRSQCHKHPNFSTVTRLLSIQAAATLEIHCLHLIKALDTNNPKERRSIHQPQQNTT
jgi:hypothetical protein